MQQKNDAYSAMEHAISSVLPYDVVYRALKTHSFSSGRVLLVAIGKAAYSMAKAAKDALGARIQEGIVLTKSGHLGAPIDGLRFFEGGHPIVNEASLFATEEILRFTHGLNENDTVLFLVSGGGSALFEKPLVPLSVLQDINHQLLSCGASIEQINVIRKRLSAVKGGRFALHCAPAKVVTLALSDVLGDVVDTIASGPSVMDASTAKDVLTILEKSGISVSDEVRTLLRFDPPKQMQNNFYHIVGNLHGLCLAAKQRLESLGYRVTIMTEELKMDAKKAGEKIARHALSMADTDVPLAFLYGGETVVTVTGSGKGGRNQELALSAALVLDGMSGISILSFGSDGTDGPTEAAGGFVTGKTVSEIQQKGADAKSLLQNNDSYTALSLCDGLVITGPTGTNVNDLTIALVHPHQGSTQ